MFEITPAACITDNKSRIFATRPIFELSRYFNPSLPMSTKGFGVSPLRAYMLLLLFSAAQLLDIVNVTAPVIALPEITRDLKLAATESQWVVNAYTLTFGAFLLMVKSEWNTLLGTSEPITTREDDLVLCMVQKHFSLLDSAQLGLDLLSMVFLLMGQCYSLSGLYRELAGAPFIWI